MPFMTKTIIWVKLVPGTGKQCKQVDEWVQKTVGTEKESMDLDLHLFELKHWIRIQIRGEKIMQIRHPEHIPVPVPYSGKVYRNWYSQNQTQTELCLQFICQCMHNVQCTSDKLKPLNISIAAALEISASWNFLCVWSLPLCCCLQNFIVLWWKLFV